MKPGHSRFEILLPQDRRQELEELAGELGLSTSDVARVALGWVLKHRRAVVDGPAAGPFWSQERGASK